MEDLTALEVAAQKAIEDFLHTDIEYAFTLLEAATVHRVEAFRKQSVERARTALQTIRYFEGRIIDLDTRRSIHARADELEAAIGSWLREQTEPALGDHNPSQAAAE